jgi:hypothetical protein
MADQQPPMWAKIAISIAMASILTLLLVIVVGLLVNVAIRVWQ